ncbi:MAG: XRE family transcriptional regulator [Treponema sp.]|nr:XRE family transcriptional regulator [Treponema sp.]
MKFRSLNELEAELNPEVVSKARKIYEQESLNIKLKELRGKYGFKQENVVRFSQTAVSKLENRKDIKVSTLMDYLESLGMGLEITALTKGKKTKREILLSFNF